MGVRGGKWAGAREEGGSNFDPFASALLKDSMSSFGQSPLDCKTSVGGRQNEGGGEINKIKMHDKNKSKHAHQAC